MKKLVGFVIGFCCFVVVVVAIAYISGVIGHQRRPGGDGDERQKLLNLAYVTEAEIAPAERQLAGVTLLDRDKIAVGINIYSPLCSDGAQLLDMMGNIVHVLTDRREGCTGGWKFVRPYVDGRFLVVAEGTCSPLFLIDWESNVIWERPMNFHHDVSFDANGNIYAFSRERIRAPDISLQEPIFNDRLVILSPDGQVKKELSLAAMFIEDPALLDIIRHEDLREYLYHRDKHSPVAWDVFHANTVEVLSTKVDSFNNRSFRAGNVLFCSRHLDLIGVIDVEAERVIWHWGPGELDNPHGPTFLDNGHILVFDNGTRRGRSRIVEMDPGSGKIVATIGDNERTAFFTPANGGVQRLPNGNTLIVESQRGRLFEVAPDGAVVWEFYSFPFEDGKWKRPVLYRMPRIVEYENFLEFESQRKPSSD